MKQIYIITIISLLNLNFINSQTVTVDNPTLGSLATYTFTYVTSNAIGVGTSTPNIIYLNKPTGYPNFVAVNPLSSFAPNAVVKVNGTEIPINSTNFGTIYGSWVKASLFLIQFKNQLFLDYEEKQIYRGTDSIYASAV